MHVGNVKLNLAFYRGLDKYSDGDVEDEILKFVKENKDFTEILVKGSSWPILYHLSPLRRNLLEWFDFGKDSTVLEIGAGCGALTGLLCEKAGRVVAVELSKRRAEIIGNRHKQHNNLEIIIGNLNDIVFKEQFDFITLIGVLEYAGQFTEGKNPYRDFLLKISKLLKPDGKLIVAIENKFGLKYWAGAPEDHTGNIFEGLEGYPENRKVRTFGKLELTQLLKESGYCNLDYYYPFPDYKLPTEIFSDARTPSLGEIRNHFPSYDRDRLRLFNEKLVLENIILNKQFDFFSNSFLVICESQSL